MSEFWQTIIRQILELFLLLPMPWRGLVILLLFMIGFSWFFWRGFPWLLAKISHLLLIVAEVLAVILLWPEYLITKNRRKQGREPSHGSYVFSNFLSGIVNIFNEGRELFHKLFKYTLTKRWMPRNRWFLMAVIALPITWYVRPSLGETAVTKLFDSGVAWWYSFEGWVLNGKWSPSAFSIPPEQFIAEYCSAINKRQLTAAWNLTTTKFKTDSSLMPNGYNDFLNWWLTKVERVDLKQVTVLSKSTNSAIVDVRWQYFMKETRKLSSPESIRFFLIWDFQNNRWLLNSTKKI
ncbi:hypothetical protein ACE1CI_01525 [Aerosakkonemataceae cyanobacterium BLCC-F50]|uniref:Uncharacterized protein n=1 Tax=Floridaenema flaviceps BLCC-F50 TaxID=3153642 RepID=A0ABV4XIR4_9CYAN